MRFSVLYRIAFFFSLLLLARPVVAQTVYRISGRVSDGATGEGIPFASLAIKGTIAGAISDVDGHYTLVTKQTGDSLLVSSVGYQSRAYRVLAVATQTIDVVLTAGATLNEVKVYARGGDPAYRIMREAIRRSDRFNTDNIAAYQYESYAKTEAYLDNFTRPDNRKRKSILAKLPSVMGDDGKPAVPIFVSETYSEYYSRANPNKVKERVLKSRSSGVGITQGNLVAQLTGASFQQYNFYNNYVRLLRKDLPSPLGQYWETLYNFHLIDTVQVGNMVCFQVDFEPRQSKDIAFNGTVWIDTLQLGLAKINVHIDRRANINFVNDIQLQQEWEIIDDSTTKAQPVRLPVETSLSLDMAGGSPKNPGVLIRFLLAIQKPSVNRVYDPAFYEPALELAENYKESSPAYWKEVRPSTISTRELRAFQVVDSVRNTQPMKSVDQFVKLATYGYLPAGVRGLEVGPLLYSYAYNNVEGNRFRLGLRTNRDFSQRWSLNGYAAYGTQDKQLKYGVGVEYVIQKKPWMVVGWQHSYDIEQLGINSDLSNNALFKAFTRFGTLRRPYRQETGYTYLRRELGSGFTQTVGLRNRTFDPQYAFAYQLPTQDSQSTRYRTTEVLFETRFSPGSLTLQDNNDRFVIGSTNKPIIVFRYELGLKALHSDFGYHRFSLSLDQSFRLGTIGRTTYQVKLGYTPSTLPYPLLFIPRGSPSIYRLGNAYNLMDFFEFATDRYAGLMVEHRFQGFLFNRIPLMRQLKWRFVTTGKLLVGGVSDTNKNLTPAISEQGTPLLGFQSLTSTPYMEVGYGIENILKFLRVDAVHRLTYRTNPGASTFGIRLSTQIGL